MHALRVLGNPDLARACVASRQKFLGLHSGQSETRFPRPRWSGIPQNVTDCDPSSWDILGRVYADGILLWRHTQHVARRSEHPGRPVSLFGATQVHQQPHLPGQNACPGPLPTPSPACSQDEGRFGRGATHATLVPQPGIQRVCAVEAELARAAHPALALVPRMLLARVSGVEAEVLRAAHGTPRLCPGPSVESGRVSRNGAEALRAAHVARKLGGRGAVELPWMGGVAAHAPRGAQRTVEHVLGGPVLAPGVMRVVAEFHG